MKSFNQHNQSSNDLYKSKESIWEKVIGGLAFFAFVLIVALSGCIEVDPIPTPNVVKKAVV
jgi:hypothetical protein